MGRIINIPSAFVYDSKVVGVSHANDDGTQRQDIIQKEIHEDDVLFLEHDHKNSYDENAIKVLSKNKNQIGYLNKELAEQVLPAIINQTKIFCRVSWVNGDKIRGVGIRIEMVS